MSESQSQSRGTSQSHEANLYYEKLCVLDLPVIIYSFLKIPVLEPIGGYGRIFDMDGRNFQCDFLGHTSASLQKLLLCDTNLDNVEVKVSTLEIQKKQLRTVLSSNRPIINISPEKNEIAEPLGTSYIIAEITTGGVKTLKSKVIQL